MTAAHVLDENDRLRAGVLDSDPLDGCEPYDVTQGERLLRLRRELDKATRAQDWPEVGRLAVELTRATNSRAQDEAAPLNVSKVLASWAKAGPLVHAPTGIATLDELTDGGPCFGTRWVLAGAPDAGKTGLLVQVAHTYAERGIAVGLLGVDEEPGDMLMRFAQRCGFSRGRCEARDTSDLVAIEQALAGLPIRFYDASWTIDRAAADLGAYATEHGVGACFIVDSLQVATCDAEDPRSTVREQVTARMQTLRRVAQEHRLIALATSEMNRAAYRTAEAAEHTDDLASAKESGAIEYSARVLLALRSVKDSPDLVEVRIAKNKHGPRGGKVYLEIDRGRQTFSEVKAPDEPTAEDRAELRDAAKTKRKRSEQQKAAAAVALVLATTPGLTTRKLRASVRAQLGKCSHDTCDDAVALLGPAITVVPGKQTAVLHYLDGRAVPDSVLGEIEAVDRARVQMAKPPSQEAEYA